MTERNDANDRQPEPDEGGKLFLEYLRTKDQRTFEKLYEIYAPRLHSVVRAHLGRRRHHDAEDITQDTWLEVIQSARNFRHPWRFSSWSLGIALNLCRRARAKGRPVLSLEDTVADDDDGPIDPAFVAGSLPRTDRVPVRDPEKELERLEPDIREVFILQRKHHLSFADIARMTGVSEATVRERLKLALGTLGRNPGSQSGSERIAS
jgi:RNA polymerase sigma-70 factor, ECF subfamily